MARLLGMALGLIGVIAALLAVNGLPWGGERADGRRPDPATAAMAASPGAMPGLRPGLVSDGDAMAVMTRQVVQSLRQATPGPGARVEALARRAAAAQPADAYILALRTELLPIVLDPVPLAAALPHAAEAIPPDPGHAPRPRPAGDRRFHTVSPGETLTTIAERAYGRASAWGVIYAANRDRLARPDLVPLGTVLVLPRLP